MSSKAASPMPMLPSLLVGDVTDPVLSVDDGPPIEVFNPDGQADCLVVCDHASNRIPERFAKLGLATQHLGEHIAWDIGAAVMARRLAERLDAPAMLTRFSRLIVDCNRYLDHPAAFVAVSDEITVPGNAGLSAEDKEARAAAVYWPYHEAMEAWLGDAVANGRVPTLIACHTMTDRMRGKDHRPEEVTVCWDRDARLAVPFIDNLKAVDGLVVGDNVPYGLDLGEDYTVPEHAMRRGLPHLQFEVRQDLVTEEREAVRYADILYDAIAEPLASSDAHRLEHHWPLDNDIQVRR